MLNEALYGTCRLPRDEIWLRDSDVIVVPKTTLRVADDAIELAFTRGIYRLFLFTAFGTNFASDRSRR